MHYENQKQFTLLFTYMMLFCLVNLLVNWQAMQRAYTDVHQPGWWLNNLIQFLVLWISLQTSAYYPSISHVYITMDIAILAVSAGAARVHASKTSKGLGWGSENPSIRF